MGKPIPLQVKRTCLEMRASGASYREIYNTFFKEQFDHPQHYDAFCSSMRKWSKKIFPDETTLEAGTYEGFIAHDATVQVSKDGEIVQAWIKQKATDIDMDAFMAGVKANVEPYQYKVRPINDAVGMLEIPLFDMHWGLAFMDYYAHVLEEILEVIDGRNWSKIIIPFGQDFFHNDSLVNGITSNGTQIEKVDMERAVKEAKQFIFTIIEASIDKADEVRVIYTPGNHDRSTSWMFMQVLLERYGEQIVDDSMAYRKCFAYGKNAVMVTHGDSKRATPRNLANLFPVMFPEEFSKATKVREVHSGHLHHEGEADIFGVMVRRLSTGGKTDDWSDKEDFVGSHKRFMLFHWGLEKLKAIYYI